MKLVQRWNVHKGCAEVPLTVELKSWDLNLNLLDQSIEMLPPCHG